MKTKRHHTFQKIHDILTPAERRSALALLSLMIVSMMLETLGVGLVLPIITLLTQENLTAHYPFVEPLLMVLGYPDAKELVIGGMLGLAGMYFIKVAFLAFLALRQTHFAFGVRARLSQSLFNIYLRQPYTFHLQRNSAQLIRNTIDEVNVFAGQALIPGIVLLTECLVIFGISCLLLLIEPTGALIVAVVLGGAAWGFQRVVRAKITRWGQARLHHDGMRIQYLQQGLGGAKDVKLLGREDDFLARYSLHNIQSTQAGQFQAALQQFPRLWLELLAVTGMALLVISMLAQGSEMAGIVPTLGLFALAAFRLMPSVNRILGSLLSLRYGLAVVDVLHEELELPAHEAAAKSASGMAFQHEIRLEGLGYTYPEASAPALNGLSIVIREGESVGFIGSSGAGKSTLVDVILGLLPPQVGRVMVDGHDIRQSLRSWQDNIGYVPQAIYLTDDSLRRNVAFGLADKDIDEASVRCAIRSAQLEDFVASLPDGIETVVGERGIRLSGGQRQRIGIARALYRNPPVLVLDEATSALDTDTERGVMQAIAALRGGGGGDKTIIIVAHRLSTVEHCDKLYRLERGNVAEEMMPAEIFNTNRAVPAD